MPRTKTTTKGRTGFNANLKKRTKGRGFVQVYSNVDEVIKELDSYAYGIDDMLETTGYYWLVGLQEHLLEDTENRSSGKSPPWKSDTGSLAAGHVIRQTTGRNWELYIDAAQNPQGAKRKSGNLDYAASLESSQMWAWVSKGVDTYSHTLKDTYNDALENFFIKRRIANEQMRKDAERRDREIIRNIKVIKTTSKGDYYDIDGSEFLLRAGTTGEKHGDIRMRGKFIEKWYSNWASNYINKHKTKSKRR